MLKNKILLIILIILCVYSCLCVPVFASSDDSFTVTSESGTVFTMPAFPEALSDYNHYVVLHSKIWDYFYLIPFNETFEVYDNCETSFDILCDGVSWCEFCWISKGLDGWHTPGTQMAISKTNNPCTFVTSCSCFSSYQSNLQDAIDGNVGFFLNRNQVLVPIMEKAPLTEVLQEILEILPIVLVIIAGLIGLRKALKFLSTALRRS